MKKFILITTLLISSFSFSQIENQRTTNSLSPSTISMKKKGSGEVFQISIDKLLFKQFDHSGKNYSRQFARCQFDKTQHPSFAPWNEDGFVVVPQMRALGHTWNMSTGLGATSDDGFVKSFHAQNDLVYKTPEACELFNMPFQNVHPDNWPVGVRVVFSRKGASVSLAWNSDGKARLYSDVGLGDVFAEGQVTSWY